MTNLTRADFTPMNRMQRGRPLRIAHRGASAYAPENSLSAFHKAAEMGADMVEIDLRVTADEITVVAHDDNLRRLFGVDGTISSLSYAALQRVAQQDPTGREPIPTFAAVAELCAELKLGLYLDIKQFSRDSAIDVISTLDRFRLTPNSIFGSFQPDLVAGLKAFDPKLLTSILYGSVAIEPVPLAHALHCDFVHPCWENAAPEPHKLLTAEWIAQVRTANLGIVCWHEERPTEISALAALGVDAICSDTPDILTQFTP